VVLRWSLVRAVIEKVMVPLGRPAICTGRPACEGLIVANLPPFTVTTAPAQTTWWILSSSTVS
jgi:hypothetical protein